MAAAAPGPAAAPGLRSSQLLTCVVVDDVASNRELFGRLLQRRGVATVHFASDGAEALRVLERADVRAAVQCVFLDKEMPVMDGHECVSRLRESGLTVPVIGVTGNALSEDRLAFTAAGASAVVSKPVRIELVEQTLAVLGLRLAPARSRAQPTY